MFYKKKAYYLITLIIFCYQLPSYCLELSPKIPENKISNPIRLTTLLSSIQTPYVSENQDFLNNLNKQEHKNTQPTDKKEGWSEWQSWTKFPHHQIQLGVSNSDYGGLMDMEYKCFNKVSSDNFCKGLRSLMRLSAAIKTFNLSRFSKLLISLT